MTFTTADLQALQDALVSGAKYVRIGDRLIQYRDQQEIIEAIIMVQKALAFAADPTNMSTSLNTVQATFKRGTVPTT